MLDFAEIEYIVYKSVKRLFNTPGHILDTVKVIHFLKIIRIN